MKLRDSCFRRNDDFCRNDDLRRNDDFCLRGFSLLEMLVALALFSFMFLFITQMVRQNHRQAKKIKKDFIYIMMI